MTFLLRTSQSLLALFLCLLAGSVSGVYAPRLGEFAHLIGQVYLAIINMASLPLLVVATFFGLRQMIALPHPGRRVLMIISLGLLTVLFCAAIGIVTGKLAPPGAHLEADTRSHLGSLVQEQGAGSGDTEMRLFSSDSFAVSEQKPWSNALPDNFFRALSEGRSLGILSCALIFGIGFAVIARKPTNRLNQLFEGSYRALELIIQNANILLPIVAFGMTAHLVTQTNLQTVYAMSSFLLHFVFTTFLLCTLAVGIICQRSKHSPLYVLQQLKAPMLVSVMSSSTMATIPHTIEAMSSRLGFSRGVVELLVPTSSVFLRAGSALYYVLLTLFVANLYGKLLSNTELGVLCLAATFAALSSAGSNSLTNVVFASFTLYMLQLPTEAAVALFLAIDILCEGPRNLLTLLASCALIALVSAGLPSERTPTPTEASALLLSESAPPFRLVFERIHLVILGCAGVIAALLIVCMGILTGIQKQPLQVVHPVHVSQIHSE